MTTQPKLVIITGPSGSGKTTLENGLANNLRIRKLVSFTTREPRQGEENGKDYWFVTRLQVSKWEEAGDVIEKVEFGGHIYGLRKTELAPLANGEGPDGVVVLEPHGVDIIADVCAALNIPYKIIILIPPLETVCRQLVKRYMLEGTIEAENKLISRLPTLIYECHEFYEGIGPGSSWTENRMWEYSKDMLYATDKSVLWGEEEHGKLLAWLYSGT